MEEFTDSLLLVTASFSMPMLASLDWTGQQYAQTNVYSFSKISRDYKFNGNFIWYVNGVTRLTQGWFSRNAKATSPARTAAIEPQTNTAPARTRHASLRFGEVCMACHQTSSCWQIITSCFLSSLEKERAFPPPPLPLGKWRFSVKIQSINYYIEAEFVLA